MNSVDAEARAIYERKFQVDRRDSFSILFDLVPDGIEVLDVGIGGGALGRRLASERGCQVDGVTISADEELHSRYSYRRIEVIDLNNVGLETAFPDRRYGAIICADVLEHLARPMAVLDSCRRMLTDGGRLLVSIPNVGYGGLIAELLAGEFRYREEGLLDRTHIRFFTRRSLLRMMADGGWQVDSVEPVILDLHHSEFRPAFDLLSPAVRRSLLSLPDALTYQFVARAHPASAEARPNASAGRIQVEPIPTYLMRLCLEQTAGFAAELTVAAAARIGEHRQRVRFPLPEDVGSLTGLRLEPADRPGFLNLHSMRLLDAHGAPLWVWDCDVGSLQSGTAREVFFRSPGSAGRGAALLLTGEHPFFSLPGAAAAAATRAKGATLEVELAWPMSPEYLLFKDELLELRQQQEKLERELAQARAAWQEANELASKRAAELEVWREQFDAEAAVRAADLRCATEEIASLAHALDQAGRSGEAVREQLGRLRQHVSDLEASRWTKLGASLARRLGRTGSPLLRSMASFSPAEPLRALRPPRAGVSIVVPVYRGLAETQTCLESVLRSTSKAQLRIVVVNDASPEPEITSYLRQVAARDARVELIENASNVGFVASANAGMQCHPDDDVVLLNSDTEVAGDWIDRLREAAYRERSVATVTPFANAATICSYPRFCVEGPMPADMSTAALDRYFAAENAGQLVDLPTAVGFCMFIRRDCIDEVGLFDAQRFGRGYGEENDFCMRARVTGWRHVLALDTFVRHSGGVSFGAEKLVRVQEAQQLLAALHPDYAPAVALHLQEDPARPARLKVDLARIRASGLPSVLFVSGIGGDTERHQRQLADALAAQANVFLLRPAGGDETVLEWLRAREGFQLAFRLPGEHEALLQALLALGVAHIHFHDTRGQSARVLELPQSLGVKHDFTAPDFFSVCPQMTLTDETGRYCGESGPEQCAACLARRPAPGGASIASWRADYGRLFDRARYVFAPSADAAARLRRYLPSINAVHAPHLDIEAAPAPPAPQPLAGGRPLRIVVMGALSQIKGADVFEATAALASQRGSRLEFHLLGYACRDLRVVPGEQLTVHGEYAEKDLPVLLQALQPDLAWFPALWPETYSYTLSAALDAGLPVVAPDIGAFPERLSGRPWTWVCPWYWLSDEWVQFFEGLVARRFDPGSAPDPAPLRPTDAPVFSYTRDYLRDVHRPALTTALPAEFLQRHRATGNP